MLNHQVLVSNVSRFGGRKHEPIKSRFLIGLRNFIDKNLVIFSDEDEDCSVLSEGSETSECRADTDDEGIERDAEPAPRRRRRRRRFMLKDVIEVRIVLFMDIDRKGKWDVGKM